MSKVINLIGLMENKNYIYFAIIIVLVIGGFVLWNPGGESNSDSLTAKLVGNNDVVVYKSPNCGCCALYGAYLERRGLDVRVENVEDMNAIKEKYGIPHLVRSCHTTVIGNNVIEGHIPIEAINAMMESEDVFRIAMPGMPMGAPGMGGAKMGKFTVYSFTEEGDVDEFMSL